MPVRAAAMIANTYPERTEVNLPFIWFKYAEDTLFPILGIT